MSRRGARGIGALILTGILGAALTGTSGCGVGSDPDRKQLTVLAAASLTESFTALERAFEKEHPGVEVTVAFDSSATLAAQALDGAPGDVLATADQKTMETAAEVAPKPTVFARNTAVLVVPADNPAGIEKVADLDDSRVDFVTCVASAPCGGIADDLLERAGIEAAPSSRETDVKSVLAKVAEGEADAGIVYRTDALAAGDAVRRLPLPGAAAHPTDYPIAVLDQSGEPDLAAQFVDLVDSPTGRRILAEAGFSRPEA